MKKFTILIPIYNDWESLTKLLNNINENIKNIKGAQFDCIIVNDCSTIINPKIKIPPLFSILKEFFPSLITSIRSCPPSI